MKRQEADNVWQRLNELMLQNKDLNGYRPYIYYAGNGNYKVAIRETYE